jgi:hypothetical protein
MSVRNRKQTNGQLVEILTDKTCLFILNNLDKQLFRGVLDNSAGLSRQPSSCRASHPV